MNSYQGLVKEEILSGNAKELDKDFMCPICMQRMNDAFLTSCGHSFCYCCVTTHLNTRQSCPSCGSFLTREQLFPNFLLNKILNKASAVTSSPVESLKFSLQQGEKVSVEQLDSLMSIIAEKRQKAEQEEAQGNMDILLEFLNRSARVKLEELIQLKQTLKHLDEDIGKVQEKRKQLEILKQSSSTPKKTSEGFEQQENKWGGMAASADIPALASLKRKNFSPGKVEGLLTESNGVPAASSVLDKKIRVFEKFDELQQCYLQSRKQNGLEKFQDVLSAFTKYSRLKVTAELKQGDLFHYSNIVSSIEFDRNDELFATAGVARRIKVFNFNHVLSEVTDIHCPVVEMPTRSKLSCLSWNKQTRSYIASSDYEGIVTVWDVNTSHSVIEYEEHEKRAWSVDFSDTEPTRLVSGSDDGKVKIWTTRQENSVATIDTKANICCVKFNPESSFHVAVGSADHSVHYFDIRMHSSPLFVFSGHQKAVSYVKFISATELVSASTDSTLRVWDVQRNTALRTLRGHTNDKNFVGLSVTKDFIASGSETNEVYVYHKEMSKPTTVHSFGSSDSMADEDSDDHTAHFISSVCWKSDGQTMLAANSQGAIKVLTLEP